MPSSILPRPYHSWERGLNEHTNGLGSPVSAERHGFPVCDRCRGPGGGGSTQLTAAQGTRVPDAGGGLQRCAGTAMIALKPGMRRVRNLSSARPVRRGDCACAQFCCRGIGNGDSSHRRLRLSKFSPPGPFFIRACARMKKGPGGGGATRSGNGERTSERKSWFWRSTLKFSFSAARGRSPKICPHLKNEAL